MKKVSVHNRVSAGRQLPVDFFIPPLYFLVQYAYVLCIYLDLC